MKSWLQTNAISHWEWLFIQIGRYQVGKWSSHAIPHWRKIKCVYHILLLLIYHSKSTQFHVYGWKQNCFIWLANTIISLFSLSYCCKSCLALDLFSKYTREWRLYFIKLEDHNDRCVPLTTIHDCTYIQLIYLGEWTNSKESILVREHRP